MVVIKVDCCGVGLLWSLVVVGVGCCGQSAQSSLVRDQKI